MHKKLVKTKWWELELPALWSFEVKRGTYAIRLPSGGSVEITAAQKQAGFVNDEDVACYAKKYDDEHWIKAKKECGDFVGVGFTKREPPSVEALFLIHSDIIVMVTCVYNLTFLDQEQEEINLILNQLKSVDD